MLSDNMKKLRKAKGYSQEELATRLNVVRQTVSKWEKNLSVPDSDMLIKMAEVFEVSVSDLLGSDCPIESEKANEIATHLERINEQLAIRNRRTKTILKIIIGVIIGIIALNLLLFIWIILGRAVYTDDTRVVETHYQMDE